MKKLLRHFHRLIDSDFEYDIKNMDRINKKVIEDIKNQEKSFYTNLTNLGTGEERFSSRTNPPFISSPVNYDSNHPRIIWFRKKWGDDYLYKLDGEDNYLGVGSRI